jgi:hypothetical protein
MAIGAIGIVCETRPWLVKSRYQNVARVAELAHVLMGEQVPVHVAVRCVASGATFYAIAQMLEHPRSFFVGMALDARIVFEAPQLGASGLPVLIVTIHALHHAFIDAMPLVEIGIGPNLIVAL